MKKHIHSQIHAWRGLFHEVKDSRNLRIQILGACIVIITGVILKVDVIEWLVLFILFAGTISSELANSAIEHLSDFVSEEHHTKIKIVKDVAAASVLVWAVFDILAGIFIFVPKII